MTRLAVLVLSALFISSPAFAGKLLKVPRKTIPTFQRVEMDPNRLVVLRGPVSTENTRPVIDKITALDVANNRPIYFIINSPGGSVVDGMEVVTAMQSIRSPLVCIVESEAFSMAALISTYCPILYMHKFSHMMFHEASYGVKGSETMIQTRVKATQSYLNQIFTDVATQMGITLPEFRNLIHDEWWMTSTEVVRCGLANGIVNELQYVYAPPDTGEEFSFEDNKGWWVELDIELADCRFHAGETAKILNGFHKGCVGTVTGVRGNGTLGYIYLLTNVHCNGVQFDGSIAIEEENLTKIR